MAEYGNPCPTTEQSYYASLPHRVRGRSYYAPCKDKVKALEFVSRPRVLAALCKG